MDYNLNTGLVVRLRHPPNTYSPRVPQSQNLIQLLSVPPKYRRLQSIVPATFLWDSDSCRLTYLRKLQLKQSYRCRQRAAMVGNLVSLYRWSLVLILHRSFLSLYTRIRIQRAIDIAFQWGGVAHAGVVSHIVRVYFAVVVVW